MTPEEEFFLRRVRDVSGRSGRYGYLGFLNEAEAALCRAMARGGSLRPMTLYGGYPDAQRCMARFGSAEETGYEEPWPIARLILKPAAGRFGEEFQFVEVFHHLAVAALLQYNADKYGFFCVYIFHIGCKNTQKNRCQNILTPIFSLFCTD